LLVAVKKSRIEGKGVFAARDIRKDEVVLKWDLSQKLGKKDFLKLPEKKYVSYSRGKLTMMQPPERYVNHSCNPNTKVKDFCDVASRSIKKGEEITSDYSADSLEGFKCNCGSENCKIVIKPKKSL
jgi:SET domain-containing protein